jgi:hypothetical protein
MQSEQEQKQKLIDEQYYKQQMDELNIKKQLEKENEFNRQQQYIMDKIREYLKIDITNEEISALVNDLKTIDTFGTSEYRSIEYRSIQYRDGYFLDYYFKKKTIDDLLIVKKLYNRFATYHNIRYKDSYEIISTYLENIKPLNAFYKYESNYYIMHKQHQENENKKGFLSHKKPFIGIDEYKKKYIPIFCDSTYIYDNTKK